MRDDKLQEIIESLPYSIRYSGEIEELLDYAKEQAERVQELEEELYSLRESAYQTQIDFLEVNGKKNVLEEQNQRYHEILNASRGIIKDAIYALDNNKKVQGLEFAVKIINRALEGEE